ARPCRRGDGRLPHHHKPLVAPLAGRGRGRPPGPLLAASTQSPTHTTDAGTAGGAPAEAGEARSAAHRPASRPGGVDGLSHPLPAGPAPPALAGPSHRRGDPPLRARTPGRPRAHGRQEARAHPPRRRLAGTWPRATRASAAGGLRLRPFGRRRPLTPGLRSEERRV